MIKLFVIRVVKMGRTAIHACQIASPPPIPHLLPRKNHYGPVSEKEGPLWDRNSSAPIFPSIKRCDYLKSRNFNMEPWCYLDCIAPDLLLLPLKRILEETLDGWWDLALDAGWWQRVTSEALLEPQSSVTSSEWQRQLPNPILQRFKAGLLSEVKGSSPIWCRAFATSSRYIL